MQLTLERWASPLCQLSLVTDSEGLLRALDFENHEPRLRRLLRDHYGTCSLEEGTVPHHVTRALQAYFDGDIAALVEVPTATGGTMFQRTRVAAGPSAIPPGHTISYGQLAANIGCPSASRAVGAANGRNPIAIVVPCHRVIGANGSLTGFGGGMPRKRWLIDHEARYARVGALRPGAPLEGICN